jgi:mRNA-degrading endonuclease YafQ of YafQ-DinJ toxin-antitoxin module
VRLVLLPSFDRAVSKLSLEQRARVEAALQAVRSAYGSPHAHGGIGVRKLYAGLFECRAGLGLRLVFRAVPGELRFAFVGTHDQVARYLESA